MLYDVYQAQCALVAPWRAMAGAASRHITDLPSEVRDIGAVRYLGALCEMVSRAHLSHDRPAFRIDLDGAVVDEAVVLERPFSRLLHFVVPGATATRATRPRVLVVAPLSGHFATLLRTTVRTLLADFDVYLTDWHNARDVPLDEGRFAFDEYVDDVIAALEHLGPRVHVVAVCQPAVPVLAALAVMARDRGVPPARSTTLMAGPIDARINPTSVNELAASRDIDWFERNVIATVPRPYAGAGRRVYPGFLQVSAFMNMNLERHLRSHYELFVDLVNGDLAAAEAMKTFYDEYFAVLDMPAEFYLETVERVFRQYQLARGELDHHGVRVDPGLIRRMSLLTVEGERDDVCAPGQTLAAHDLCTGIRAARKHHHLQPGVGHYGVFSGRRWETQIYPVVRSVVQAAE
jgi:poly(3-hydroxybutyrate) depolymerase